MAKTINTPKLVKERRYAFRGDVELYPELQDIAQKKGVRNVSELIRIAIAEYVKKNR